jgi:hypothetical protein
MLLPSEIQRVDDCVGIDTPTRPLAACAGVDRTRPDTNIAVTATRLDTFLNNFVPFLAVSGLELLNNKLVRNLLFGEK